MKKYLVGLALVSVGAAAQAKDASSLKKVVDGSVRHCTVAEDSSRQGVHVQMALNDSKLTVLLVQCVADEKGLGHYALANNLAGRTYTAVNGEQVHEAYSKFELVLTENETQIIDVIPLENIEQTSRTSVTIGSINKGTEFFIRGVRSYKAESGLSDRNTIKWGAYRF